VVHIKTNGVIVHPWKVTTVGRRETWVPWYCGMRWVYTGSFLTNAILLCC